MSIVSIASSDDFPGIAQTHFLELKSYANLLRMIQEKLDRLLVVREEEVVLKNGQDEKHGKSLVYNFWVNHRLSFYELFDYVKDVQNIPGLDDILLKIKALEENEDRGISQNMMLAEHYEEGQFIILSILEAREAA